jgi:hypothetical protein
LIKGCLSINAVRRWLLHAFEVSSADNPALQECRVFLAGALHEHGRRPQFADGASWFTDAQPLDPGAWHLTARRTPGSPILGYVRPATPQHRAGYQRRAFL